MTEEQRAELEKLARAATGGDWRAHITTKRSPEIYTNIPPPNTPNPLIAGTILRKADARFIAAANPATVLDLLATIARLEAERDDLRAGAALDENAMSDGVYALESAAAVIMHLNGTTNRNRESAMTTIRARLSSRARDQSQ